MNQRLWHVSDREDIPVFAPRPVPPGSDGVVGTAVWAISEVRLANYLLPRECPRVCFWRSEATSAEDRDQFLGNSSHAVVVERDWLSQLSSASVWLYEMPPEPFAGSDENAGYYISRVEVSPYRKLQVVDLPAAITKHGAELRSTSELRALASRVASSTLSFSIIRLRNAQRTADAA
jgi:hypothetical protein